MERGEIVTLATVVIPPENTPVKLSGQTLVARPRWKYIGPADTIRFEWQIGRWGWAGFAGETARRYKTASQTASAELKEFYTDLPAISLSPLSPSDDPYDCEIWFKDKFSDLRVIIENCVKVVEEAPAEEYSLEISIEPPDTGYVTREPPDVTYPAGSRVRLTAKPYDETKYKFDHWGGDISGTTNPIDITMNKNMWVVAAFKSIEKYTIDGITVPEGAGYWYLEPYKDLYERLDVVKITAFANVGYGFDYWLVNGSKAAYNPASVIVMRDVWIECHFRSIS